MSIDFTKIYFSVDSSSIILEVIINNQFKLSGITCELLDLETKEHIFVTMPRSVEFVHDEMEECFKETIRRWLKCYNFFMEFMRNGDIARSIPLFSKEDLQELQSAEDGIP